MGLFLHNDKFPEIIWDRISIKLSINNNRVDVGKIIEPQFEAFYEYDGALFNGSIFYNTELTSNDVRKKTIYVERITDEDRSVSIFYSNEIDVIWDRINIVLKIDKPRVEIGSQVDFNIDAIYEFDGRFFKGEILFNHPLKQVTLGEKIFRVRGIVDSRYNLTAFKSNQVSCIFDDIVIEQEFKGLNPTQVHVLTRVNFLTDLTPVNNASVKVNGIGEHVNLGEYRSTVYTWKPYTLLRTEVKLDGWDMRFIDKNFVAMGNIFTVISITAILISVSAYQLFKKKYRPN
jgi:hypothetical protein